MKKLLLMFAILFAIVTVSMAVPPDLTAGGVPDEDPAITINLGPTGARGWVHHVKIDTSESRQILVTAVDTGSPADGILAVDDVILGADGTGANPVAFSSDARKSLGWAIGDAEARTPATLKLLRWRSGSTTTVSLTLQTMGAYSATAPYSCPKSALILQQGLQYVYDNEDAGAYSFGAITMLADGNPTYQAKAQTAAVALIPDQATMTQMMSDDRDTTPMVAWQRGHVLIFLTEYYLATGDTQVLPAIEAYAVNIAKNTSLFGTTGHGFAEKNTDGSPNGPNGDGYGTVNTPALFCLIGMELAKECGVTNSVIDPGIERAIRFFAYYSGKGAIPYGDHEPYFVQHENNGKCGTAALAFMFQETRVEEAKFFAKMCTASATEREMGHTGAYFNYVWAPLGAAVGGPDTAAALFARLSWVYDLSRCWDGSFKYDCLNGEGPIDGSEYNNFRMSTAALLTYALPLRELRITGKGHDSGRWLNGTDAAEAIAADDYDATIRSDSELIADLDSWSPKVRYAAGEELGNRTIDASELSQITALANNTGGSSRSRAAACYALGQIGDSSSAATLAVLLTDSDNYVRYLAGEGMRYLPKADNLVYLDTILTAADTTAQPLYPMVDEDPMHFAHGRLAMLLFYSGSVYGPQGVINGSGIDGVDRGLLYPAIRAIAETPVGMSRSTLEKTYENLDYNDVLTLSGTIVDSIVNRAPADRMFSHSVRAGGVASLYNYGIAEGVPAGMIYAADTVWNGANRIQAYERLGAYAGSVNTVTPDPGTVEFLESYVDDVEVGPTVQTILAAIAADTNPTPLTAFKSILSATVDDTSLTLPNNSTVLRVDGFDHAQGDSVYTWRKLSGPGTVSFSDNGTAAAAISTLTFDNNVGTYQFEVTMSDSRALTEEYATVTVDILAGAADVTSPAPDPMTWALAPVAISNTEITMTASTATDTSGVEYYFDCTAGPGNDSGWQDSPIYTDIALAPGTEYTYTVTARDKSVNQNATAASTAASATTTGTALPLKIFIMAGQSNTEGHGEMSPVETQGTLEYIVNSDPGTYGHLKDGAGWTVCDDAWIWYKRGGTTLLTGGLSAGFGASSTTIGPELQFGCEMGNAYGQQILIIKTAWGGKSLGVDFRPPSSGWSVNPPVADGDQGYYYQEMMNYVSDVLTNLATYFPTYNPADGYEIAGFGWHQGWNDRVTPALATEYEVNMVNFITDIRTDLGVSDLPFVIATTGMDGNPDYSEVELAQLAMEDFVTYPQFNGNVAVVDTQNFWHDVASSPADQVYHWNRNAETYFQIGRSMALELQSLIVTDDTAPPTPNPARFGAAPAADSDTEISMTAATGSDLTGPVEYLFTETSGNAGGTSSDWQTNPTYTDTGLLPETVYTYTVTMRDGLGYTGTASAAASASTMSYIDIFPPTPNPATFAVAPMTSSATSISMVATTGSDINGPVEYLFTETSGNPGGASSGWQTSESYTDTGLTTGMAYTYTVTMRDSIGNVGAASAPVSAMATDMDFFSVNFYAYGSMDPADYDKVTLEADESAGVGSWNAIGWENYLIPWGLSSPASPVTITSVLGSTATFTLNEVRNGGPYLWSSPHTNLPGDGNGDLMDGHANGTEDPGDGTLIFDMTVSDITADTYDVVIYMGCNAAQYGDGTAKIVFNGGPVQDFKLTSGAYAAFAEITDSVTPGNYIVFENVTGSSFTVQVWGNGFNHIAPTGFQFASPPDTSPPTPNPATFVSPPAAAPLSNTEIRMTATTGTDSSGPVEYYFAETSGNPGGTDSGWTTNPVYYDTGLDPETQYTYTVTMRDSLGNTGTASAPANATTRGSVADIISVNFYAYGALDPADYDAVTLEAGEYAGVGLFNTNGWENYLVPWSPTSPRPPVTITSVQAATATLTLNDVRNGGPYTSTPHVNFPGDGNGDLMDGHCNATYDPGDGSNIFDMVVSDIPYASYDVIFYMGCNAAQYLGGTANIVFNGGSEQDFTLTSGEFAGFAEITNPVTPGNYIVFTGVTGSSFTVQVWGDGFNHIGPTGFQIVATGAPVNDPVPDVVGMTQANAEAAIVAAGFTVGTVTTAYSDTVAAGDVISQSPTAGTPTAAGSPVDIEVSLGVQMVTVPDVVGQALATVEPTLIAAQLTLGIATTAYSDTVALGDVISQNPTAGSSVVHDSAVDIVVSLGVEMVTVPNVVGQAQATAEANIIAAQLVVGTVTTAYSDTVPAGDVISQNPTGGASVVHDSAVDLVVSLGVQMVTVPNVVGQTQATAEANIVAAQLVVGNVTTASSPTVPAGDVISQNPAGSTSAAIGSSVDLVVSTGPAPAPPAAPSGLSATAISKSQIDISWTDNATNETGFKIERSDRNNGNFVQIATVGADVTSFSDTGLKKNTTYYYRVRATNASGDSAYSNEASAKTPK
ncbi:MAG: DUF6288 domain-containing protein [Phycisphaerae bacterium]|nr:DUF6288 domain-containing protein [Phycisphaerae bacterium]